MRPLNLVIEGLRSFRTPVTIDFEHRDQLAIVGDTGAGKSSVLDAITYALYRQTTFSKQPNQELMNASAAQTRVVLTFRISGQTWTVTRALKRTNDGVASVSPELSRLGDDGEKLDTLASVASVDDRIQELVGLDGDAFLRTVVLPQGNFARLLIADTPAERSSVLRQVWRTDELERAGQVAEAKGDEAKALRIELDAQASRYPEDPDAHLKTLSKDRTAARKEAKRAKNGLDAASAAVAALDAAAQEAELSQGVLDDLDGAEVSELAVALDQLQSVADEIDGQDKALAEEAAEIEAGINKTLQDDDRPSLARITATTERLSQVDNDIRKLAETADDWRVLREKKADADNNAAEAEQLQSEAKQAVEEHREERKALGEALDDARKRLSDVEGQYTALEAAQHELRDWQGQLEAQRVRKAQLDEAVKAKQTSKERADDELSDARRADSAASAAHGLHVGDHCPVCDRELPADWQRPISVRMGEAEREAGTAAAVLQQAQRRAEEAGIALAEASTECAMARQWRDEKLAESRNAMKRLGEAVPDIETDLPPKSEVLAPLSEKSVKAQRDIDQHDRRQVRLGDVLRDATAEAEEAKKNADNLALQMAEAYGRFSTKGDAIRRTLDALPPQFRPCITLPDDPSMDFEAIDAASLGEVRCAAKNVQAKLESLNELREQREALSRRRDEDVDEPLADVVARANQLLATVNLAVGKLGSSFKLPAALAMADLPKIRSWLIEIREALEGTCQAAGKRLEAAEKKRQDADAILAKFAERFDLSADDTDAIAEAANQANIEAQTSKFQAERAFNDFSAVVAAVRQLHTVRAKIEAKRRALSALAAALKPGAFLKWLTLRRSRSLLSHASVRLKQMSGGRYAFAEPNDADAQWRVLDNDTGQARSPASLSGGEQFVASLALALGMVEMMARSGGRLESLFLDEGFGSLDRNNLDAAVEALAMVATRGRMVGVISHVRAVAEQFDNVLAVTREEGGSRAVWLSNQQRQDMATDALSGLLD